MASTITALSDQQLQDELRVLASERSTIQKRLDADKQKRTPAQAERDRLLGRIQVGTADSSVLENVKREFETLQIRINHNNDLLAKNRTSTQALEKAFHQRQWAAVQTKREKEFADRFQKSKERALQLRDKIKRIITEDVREEEELRASLFEFPDLGGYEAAAEVFQILLNPPRAQEALRNPEVHLAQLEAAGWVPFGFDIHERFDSHSGSVIVRPIPGHALRLSIVSMRPR